MHTNTNVEELEMLLEKYQPQLLLHLITSAASTTVLWTGNHSPPQRYINALIYLSQEGCLSWREKQTSRKSIITGTLTEKGRYIHKSIVQYLTNQLAKYPPQNNHYK